MRREFKNLGVDEFAKLAADKQNVILDVRTSGEYKAGHLAGAVNLDVNAPDFKTKVAELDKNKGLPGPLPGRRSQHEGLRNSRSARIPEAVQPDRRLESLGQRRPAA